MDNKTKVLAICQREIPSALVGVNKPLRYLAEQEQIDFQFVESINVKKNHIAWADVLVCIRGSEELELNIVKECTRLGKYTIYFLDDDLLNVPVAANSSSYFSNAIIKEMIMSIMSQCNCLWTTNINIEKKYKDFFEKTVTLHAPALLLQNNTDDECINQVQRQDKVVIGFSGGIDYKDFLEKTLEEPIKLILEKYPNNIEFEFFGARPSFIEELGLTYIPYESDHITYGEIIKSRCWDIGLAPLPQSGFHACKYFNKFLEYGAIGAAGIYSSVEPYTHIVEEGTNGLLVDNNPKEWVDAISILIENSELRGKIRSNALEQLKQSFSLPSITELVKRKIPETVEYKAPYCLENQVKYNEVPNVFFINKVINVFKREGLNAPLHIIKRIILKIKTNY